EKPLAAGVVVLPLHEQAVMTAAAQRAIHLFPFQDEIIRRNARRPIPRYQDHGRIPAWPLSSAARPPPAHYTVRPVLGNLRCWGLAFWMACHIVMASRVAATTWTRMICTAFWLMAWHRAASEPNRRCSTGRLRILPRSPLRETPRQTGRPSCCNSP